MPIKLKTTVDDIATVPEAYRSQYKADNGKFVLQELEIPDSADLSGLIKNRDELLREKKALEQKYAGIDVDKYQQMTKAQQDAERQRLESRGEWDALEKQLLDKHAEELKKKDDEIGSLTLAVEQRLVDHEAIAAITAAKGNPVLLLPHVKQFIKVFKEDGRFIAKVVDPNGVPRIGDAKGNPMTVMQLIEEMKSNEVYGRAFEATYARGTGAQPGNRARGSVVTITREQFDRMDGYARAEFFKENKGAMVVD